MKKLLLPALFVIASLLILVSCVDKKYTLTGDIDYAIGADMTIVAPVGHTNIKLYEPLPDSFHSFKFKVLGERVFLTKREQQRLGDEVLEKVKLQPKGEFTQIIEINNPIPLPQGEKPFMDVDASFEYTFGDLNKHPERERLDSILYKPDQKLEFKIKSPFAFKEDSYFDIVVNNDELSLDPEIYAPSEDGVTVVHLPLPTGVKECTVVVDVSRSIIKFARGAKESPQIFNNLNLKFKGQISTDDAVPAYAKISLSTKFDSIKPRATFGYIGKEKDFYQGTNKIPFAYTEDISGTDFFLPFENPEIKIDAENTIGIPVEYILDSIWLWYYNSETGLREKVFATFDGGRKDLPLDLKYPLYSDIEPYDDRYTLSGLPTSTIGKQTTKKLNNQFGHTEQLFQVRGDTLEYHYTIKPKDCIETDPESGYSFFFDDSDIDVVFDASLELRFLGNEDPLKNFYINRTDTLKIDFKGMSIEGSQVGLSDETVARVKLNFINHLPVNGDAEYSFINADGEQILTNRAGVVKVEAPPMDASGTATGNSVETNAYIKLDYADFKELTKDGYAILLKYNIINKKLTDVWFKSNDWIDVTAEVWAKGFIVYNPKEGGEK